MAASPPLSLYVHIPWCVRKCPYCDFNSHARKEKLPEAAYLTALLQDLDEELRHVEGRQLETVFIGGGTPSLFSPHIIAQLITGIRARIPLAPQAEITLEANPGTVEHGLFSAFRSAGVTRLSIGVQSFDDRLLHRLGRIHSGQEAHAAIAQAHQAGFESFNLDLMFGLPEQSLAQALADIRCATAFHPAHISYYQLTLEPNTAFHHAPPTLPPDDTLWEMQCQGQHHLQEAGYLQYEVSAFAQKQQRCRHNLNYWTFGDYLGIGAGAHGKITSKKGALMLRTHKQRHPTAYLNAASQGSALAGSRQLHAQELPLEFMMNALRLSEGFALSLFSERTGLSIECLRPALAQAQSEGLLTVTNGLLRPTSLGKRYLNNLLMLF